MVQVMLPLQGESLILIARRMRDWGTGQLVMDWWAGQLVVDGGAGHLVVDWRAGQLVLDCGAGQVIVDQSATGLLVVDWGAGQLVVNWGAGYLSRTSQGMGRAGQGVGRTSQLVGWADQGAGRTGQGVGRAGMVAWRQAWAGLRGGAGEFGLAQVVREEVGRAGVGLRGCGRTPRRGTVGGLRDGRIVGGAAVRLVHHAHTAHPEGPAGTRPLPGSLGRAGGRGRVLHTILFLIVFTAQSSLMVKFPSCHSASTQGRNNLV